MNIVERLNEELNLIYGKESIQEYKKWRRPKKKRSSKLLPIVQNISTAAQVYDKSIKYIMNKESNQELSNIQKNEIIKLITEFDKNLDDIKLQSDVLEPDDKEEVNSKLSIIKTNNNKMKSILKEPKIFKVDVNKFLKTLEPLFTAKLTKGAVQAFALSNPLTAVIYQNWDIPKGVYNAIS